MLNYIEFCGDGFGRDVISADSPQFEGIEGNRLLRAEEIRPNPATIALVKFFVYVMAGSNWFERVAVLPIGSVRKAAVDDRWMRILKIFFHIFSPHGADSPFQMRVTHTHTQKSGLIFRYIYRSQRPYRIRRCPHKCSLGTIYYCCFFTKEPYHTAENSVENSTR